MDDVVVVDEGVVADALDQEQQQQELVLRQQEQVADAQDGDASPAESEVPASQASEVMVVTLSDAQYADLNSYMATQLYVSLSILVVVALVLGAVLAQQVLSRWGVR